MNLVSCPRGGQSTAATDVVDLALATYRAPLDYHRRLAASAPLPLDMDRLLALAHDAESTLGDTARSVGVRPDELRDAVRFLIQQLCFVRGASHYRVLGLEPDASPAQIKERHRRLMWLFHPDRAVGCATWTDGYATRINDAWNTLSHPASRANYDIQQQPGSTGDARCTTTGSLGPAPAVGRHALRVASRKRRVVHNRRLPMLVLGGCMLVAVVLVGAIHLIGPATVPQSYTPIVVDIAPAIPNNAAELEWESAPQHRTAQDPTPAQHPLMAVPAEQPAMTRAADAATPPRMEPVHPTVALAVAPPLARDIPVTPVAPRAERPPDQSGLTGRDVENFLDSYTKAYQRGDLSGLMALFAPGARGKRGSTLSGIRQAYAMTLGSFIIRRLQFHDMRWTLHGDAADVSAVYELSLLQRTTSQLSQLAGNIRMTLHKRDGQVLIETIDYSWRTN